MKSILNLTALTLGVFTCSLVPSAFAASATWDGDTSAFWNNSANWSAAFPNANSDIATFNINSGNNTIDLGQNINVRQILFDSANVGAYTINGTNTQLTFATSGALGVTINANVGAVTQTINARANLQLSTSFTNSSSSALLNLAGGVNNNLGTAVLATFTGAGNGGTINGLSQTGGGALSATISNSAGIFELTGTTSATGTLSITGAGGARISSDVSSMTLGTITGRVQINNALAGGGFNTAGGMTMGSGSILEAVGEDRTINTTTLTLNGATFTGSQSLTMGSVTTMAASSGQITNNISGVGKTLTFNNAGNFSLSESVTNRIRIITGTGHTIISSSVINGGGSAASGITKTGTGTLELSGDNSYAGLTTVSGGVLLLSSANALGASGGTTNLLINTGAVVGLGSGDFTRALGTGVTQVRIAGGGGGFAAYGADRNVNLGGAAATINWNQTNFIPNSAPLVLGASTSTHKVNFQNGLSLGNQTQTIQVNNGSADVDGEVSGVIAGTGASAALTKTGDGTLLLSNANTYTGLTTVSAGTLLIGTSIAGGAQVDAGAALGGNGTIAGATTISGSLRPGNSIGTLTVTNDVTWNGGNDWVFELGTSAASLALANSGSSTQDLLNITGVGSDFLKGTGTTWTFDFAGTGAAGWYKLVDWAGTTNFASGDFAAANLGSGLSGSFIVDGTTSALYLNVIPEPSSFLLLSGGLAALLGFRRLRRRVS